MKAMKIGGEEEVKNINLLAPELLFFVILAHPVYKI